MAMRFQRKPQAVAREWGGCKGGRCLFFSVEGGADEREERGCRVVVLQVAFSRDIVVGAKEVVE